MGGTYKLDKYKENLKLDMFYIYSYNDIVAEIMHEHEAILPLGCYSKNTTKHIKYVANDLGYKVLYKI